MVSDGSVVHLSILYLRCTGTRLMNALGVGWAFNSLFEMQRAEFSIRPQDVEDFQFSI